MEMKAEDLKRGVIYWVVGQGPLRLTELPDPPRKTTVTLISPEGVNYYADPAHILYPINQEQMNKYVEEMRIRLSVSEELAAWQQELQHGETAP